ncbi:MAG: endonuclease III [Candidatus Bathyarchaeota archaeon]|nr:endonuclease III [Candidatus Bathyarchaeota archaeon]
MDNVKNILEILQVRYPEHLTETQRQDPFKTLIGCILSQRTRDQNSEKASMNLFNEATTPQDILCLSEDELHNLIRCSGFYRQKAKYITGTCKTLIDHHEGRVPDTREELLKLPGVGPKTADIVLIYAYGEETVPVDVHISRVTRRLGIASTDADPETVKKHLNQSIPKHQSLLYDRAILQIGKDYCRKAAPRCPECPLNKECKIVGL